MILFRVGVGTLVAMVVAHLAVQAVLMIGS
jgi:hypothetical protein